MPELPEVETMTVGLREALMGRTLGRLRVLEGKTLRDTAPRAVKRVEGCRVVGLTRRGKFIIFHLSSGAQLLFHLKMTGRFALLARDAAPERWERLHIMFDNWDQRVSFIDQRKFGYMAVIPESGESPVPLVYELGPDALQVSREELEEILVESRRPVKALLLDQRSIAGLGNIYVDEALFSAGIHPGTRALDIDDERRRALHRSLRRILKKAIDCGGSSVRSYSDSRGTKGSYQKHHKVYGRKGERCPRCRSTILYTRVASRGTHYCPRCQPLAESRDRSAGQKGGRKRLRRAET